MSDCSSVLSQVLALIPQDAIADVVAQLGADARSRKLSALAQLKILMVSHLGGRQSLRDIVAELTYNPVLQQAVFPGYAPPTPAERGARRQRFRIAELKALPPAERWERLVQLRAHQACPQADEMAVAPISVSQLARLNARRPTGMWQRLRSRNLPRIMKNRLLSPLGLSASWMARLSPCPNGPHGRSTLGWRRPFDFTSA